MTNWIVVASGCYIYKVIGKWYNIIEKFYEIAHKELKYLAEKGESGWMLICAINYEDITENIEKIDISSKKNVCMSIYRLFEDRYTKRDAFSILYDGYYDFDLDFSQDRESELF